MQDTPRSAPGFVHNANLLQTKLHIPRLSSTLIARLGLLERLDNGVRHKLTLLCAAAGFGKTTLLSTWKLQTDRPTAWLSLDAGDNDPVRFWTYMIGAMETLFPDIGEKSLGALHSPQPPPFELILTTLLNDIAELPYDFVLILDDYHLIEVDLIHDTMAFALEHLPAQMRLIIASRVEPPLPLARLRAQYELYELRSEALRFSHEEADAFLQQVMALTLTTEQVKILEMRTEGWVAGLQLAGLSLQQLQSPTDFISAFAGSHRYVFDFLAEEVFIRQSESIQKFLLYTSVLARLSSSLGETVTGLTNGQSILSHLEKSNLFLIPLDDERHWFRYHHLFGEFLETRLQRIQPDLVPLLHRRAADWYEQHGLMDEAIIHFLAGEDYENTARLIEQQAQVMYWQRGEIATMLGWIESVPDVVVQRHPRLRLAYAWGLVGSGQLAATDAMLSEIERDLDLDISETFSPETANREFVGGLATVRITNAMIQLGAGFHIRTDLSLAQDVVRLAERALKFLPEDSLFERGLVSFSLGISLDLTGQNQRATGFYDQAARISQAIGSDVLSVMALGNLAENQIDLTGQLHHAERTCEQLTAIQNRPGGRSSPVAAYPYLCWGQLWYERNELDKAREALNQCLEAGHQWLSADIRVPGYITLAQIYLAEGDIAGATYLLQEGEVLAQQHSLLQRMARVSAYRAWIWITQGNLEAAELWAQTAGVTPDDEATYPLDDDHMVLVRLMLAKGAALQVFGLLNRLIDSAEAGGRRRRIIQLKTLKAVAYYLQGEPKRALANLETALLLAEPEGFVRSIIDEGSIVTKLLARYCEGKLINPQPLAVAHARRLLAAFAGSAARPRSNVVSLIEPLSQRETDVLRRMAAGMSNLEIANALEISVNTVKTHLKNVHDKLHVRNRVEALIRARELGLID